MQCAPSPLPINSVPSAHSNFFSTAIHPSNHKKLSFDTKIKKPTFLFHSNLTVFPNRPLLPSPLNFPASHCPHPKDMSNKNHPVHELESYPPEQNQPGMQKTIAGIIIFTTTATSFLSHPNHCHIHLATAISLFDNPIS